MLFGAGEAIDFRSCIPNKDLQRFPGEGAQIVEKITGKIKECDLYHFIAVRHLVQFFGLSPIIELPGGLGTGRWLNGE